MAINTWTDAVVLAVVNSLEKFANFLPNLLGALIIFVFGWLVAGVLRNLTLKILSMVQLEPFAEKVGLSDALKRAGATLTAPELIAELIKWATVLVFLSPTVEVLGLSQVTQVINSVLLYIPNVLVAVLIIMFGAIFADLTAQFVRGGASALGSSTARVFAVITKYAIVIFAVLVSLSQLGIAQQLIATVFTGLVAMLAIAGGLAFGLGGKDTAAEILEKLKESLRERR